MNNSRKSCNKSPSKPTQKKSFLFGRDDMIKEAGMSCRCKANHFTIGSGYCQRCGTPLGYY